MTITIDHLRGWLAESNVAAFLRVIRHGESSQGPEAYRMRFGGAGKPTAYFDDFARHPRIMEPTADGRQSSAAGAYMFTWTAWATEILGRWQLPDFSPMSQDLGCVGLLALTGRALDYVRAGQFDMAVVACRERWTSLPGAAENNAAWTLAKAREVYQQYGGTFDPNPSLVAPESTAVTDQPGDPANGNVAAATQTSTESDPPTTDQPAEPAQPEEHPEMGDFNFGAALNAAAGIATPFNPAIGLGFGLVGQLVQAFQPLAQSKITTALEKHTDPATAAQISQSLSGVIMSSAQQLTGKSDALQATAAAVSDPAIMAKIEQSALDELDRIAPYLDKIHGYSKDEWAASEASAQAAADRAHAEAVDLATPLTYSAIAGVALLLIFVGAVIIVQMVQGKPVTTEVWAALTGLIGWMTGQAGNIYSYRFGSTRQSGAKDVLIGQLAKGGGK